MTASITLRMNSKLCIQIVHDLTLANLFDDRVYISFSAEIALSHSSFFLFLEGVKFVPIFCTCYSLCLPCCSPSSSFHPQCKRHLLREALSDSPSEVTATTTPCSAGISSWGFSLFVIVLIVYLFPCLFRSLSFFLI